MPTYLGGSSFFRVVREKLFDQDIDGFELNKNWSLMKLAKYSAQDLIGRLPILTKRLDIHLENLGLVLDRAQTQLFQCQQRFVD